MKLVGELKKKVEETKNKEEAKELIENAGMQLTDEELDHVAGGEDLYGDCSNGGKHDWEYYIDSESNQLMRRCKNCGATLSAILTSI